MAVPSTASGFLTPAGPVATPAQLEKIGVLAAGLVNQGDRVGLGSGRAALAFVRALGQRVRTEKLHIVGVPTSLLTKQVARESGVPLQTLEQTEALEIAVDGADEVDPEFHLIKGGGGNLTREKVIESLAKRLIIVVGQEKIVDHLGTNFPVFIEVIEFARPAVTRKLAALGGAVTQRRHPDGSVFLTDNQNPYLMVRFGPPPHHIQNPASLEQTLRRLPGVVETGLFIDMADEIIVAKFDGTVDRLR
ncbi:MAG: ribose-5-phosphate isomerase RpiA [Phycisphaerae bacterium]